MSWLKRILHWHSWEFTREVVYTHRARTYVCFKCKKCGKEKEGKWV